MLQFKLKARALTRPRKVCSRQQIISPQPQTAPIGFLRLPINRRVRTRIKGKDKDKVKTRAMDRGKDKSRVRGKARGKVVVVEAEAVEAKGTILATKQDKTNKSLFPGKLAPAAVRKAMMQATALFKTAALSHTPRSLHSTSKWRMTPS